LIEEIGRTGIKVLLLLAEHGKLSLSDIIRTAGVGHTTLYNAMSKMKELGLVEEERIGYVRMLKLTPLGREVADYLKLADQKVLAYAKHR